jgi:hypothetical protein
METVGGAGAIASAGGGVLGRERIIARKGFNRWLVPPAALAIHLCIGMAYGFSGAPRRRVSLVEGGSTRRVVD